MITLPPVSVRYQSWSDERRLPRARQPGRSYPLYGWTRDNSSSTGDVTFTLADLEQLNPGQVRYLVDYDEKREEHVYEIGSPITIRADSCSE